MLLTENHHHPVQFIDEHQQRQRHQHQEKHQEHQQQKTTPYYAHSQGHGPRLDAADDGVLDLKHDNTYTYDLGSIAYSSVQLDGLPAVAIPRRAQHTNYKFPLSTPATPTSTSQSAFDDSSSLYSTDLMPSEAWLPATRPLTPKSASFASHHKRESSLSSLGSAGPASPYSQNTSNPHIAVSDTASDIYQDHLPANDSYYQLSKPLHPTTADTFYPNFPAYAAPDTANYSAMVSPQRQRAEQRGLLSRPDTSMITGQANTSRPVSVASSVTSDSPVTPSHGEPLENARRKPAAFDVPKLDRTMTDIYGDELYSPSFTITSASPTQPASQVTLSPSHDVFTQRLQAANSQHLSATQSPVSASPRNRSPFRQGSPLAPSAGHDFGSRGASSSSQTHFGPSQQMREQTKVDQGAHHILRQQLARGSDALATPQTVSPKDMALEFNESEDDATNFPLFPPQDSAAFPMDQFDKVGGQGVQKFDASSSTMTLDTSGPFSYINGHQLPETSVQIPQTYPFVCQLRHHSGGQSLASSSIDLPSRGSSAQSSESSVSTRDSHAGHDSPGSGGFGVQKPAGSKADGGTYTCTYHGCTMRFETPALLQKHKREGHRQAQAIPGPRRIDGPGMTSNLLNSQAGPHRCDRINPSTGKPCQTVFSRPYDLTRHEDTIHNARKQKVRCNLCTEEKTFSRADALTRHYRVCHPDVEFPGKHRRRGGHGV